MEGNVFRVLNSENPVSRELMSRIKKLIKVPTDQIEMTEKDRVKLVRMFFDVDVEKNCMTSSDDVPADIVIADTVPIRNFTFIGTRSAEGFITDHYVFQYSIFDFKDCIPITYTDMNEDGLIDPMSMKIMENIDNMEYMSRDDSDLIVGVVLVTEYACDSHGCIKFAIPIVGHHDTLGVPSILFDVSITHGSKTTHINVHKKMDIVDMSDDNVGTMFGIDGNIAVETMYAIECALLNPVILNVFQKKETKIPVSTGKQAKHNKRATIRYVKKHYLTATEIHDELKAHGFTRKALIWYVTGHWREYKNGKRIFIQGYWKGALRKSKQGEIRDRELVTEQPDTCIKEDINNEYSEYVRPVQEQ